MELRDAGVMVTGGARGIGRGIALALADAGAHVLIADVLDAPGISTAAEETRLTIAERGRRAEIVQCDVRRPADTEAAVSAALRAFGRLDVVVANAGVFISAPIAEISIDEWQRLIDINVTGVFLTCRAAAPHFIEQRRGCYVNLSSIAGKRGYPNGTAYCASKFAVVGLTQSLAAEMAKHDVRANAICPGYLGTDMWMQQVLKPAHEAGLDTQAMFEEFVKTGVPLGRAQTPADIGQAAVYLCAADNVTGVSLDVAGGIEMW